MDLTKGGVTDDGLIASNEFDPVLIESQKRGSAMAARILIPIFCWLLIRLVTLLHPFVLSLTTTCCCICTTKRLFSNTYTNTIKRNQQRQTERNNQQSVVVLQIKVSKMQHLDENDEETILRKSLAALDVKRKSMEHEADAIFMELTTPPSEGVEPMGIDTPLVDQDGYPRADIDVYRARTLRGRFRVLQTDHKTIEKQIDGMLQQLATMKVRL